MAQSRSPLLSIIIPTRDRFAYAQHAVQAALMQADADCELVIHDNSTSDELASWIKIGYNSDPRVRYHHVAKPLSISENFEQSLAQATGEYFCFIGDDDGVNPEIEAAARWAKEHRLDALLPTRCANYYWPDLLFRYGGDRYSGQLHLRPFKGHATWCEVEPELHRCVASGGQDFGNLPRVYYGIVRRDCIERVRDKCGYYLPGISPDMAGAVAVASFVNRMCLVDYPLFIPGASGGSASGLGAMKKHIGALEDQAHLSQDFITSWPNTVPRFFAGTTMWAAATVQALEATGRTDLLAAFNVPRLHALCAVYEPHWLRTTLASFHRVGAGNLVGYPSNTVQFLSSYAQEWGRRAVRLYANLTRNELADCTNEVPDIQAAVIQLTRAIGANNYPFTRTSPRAAA